MISLKDDATYLEKAIIQDNSDTDFMKVSDTTVNFLPEEIPLLSKTSETQIETIFTLNENDSVILTLSDNSFVSGNLGTISESVAETQQILDIFNDESCIACYNLDGNSNDLSRNYNGTLYGTQSFDTGKFGSALISRNDSDGMKVNTLDATVISMWVYLDSSPASNNYFYDSRESGSGSYILHNNGSFSFSGSFDVIKLNGNDIASGDAVPIGEWFLLYFEKSDGSSTNCFGDYYSLGAYYTRGLIDQIRVFNRSLTSDEIQILMNEQKVSYLGDISSFNLSEIPTKAFFNNMPQVEIAVEYSVDDITSLSFESIDILTSSYDGEKFTNIYENLAKEGRAIQRKLIAPAENITILTPFTSNLWKKES